MTLRQARVKFTALLADLIQVINDTDGYEAALAEGMDRLTDRDPTSDHMKNSLHNVGLAQDIDLYRNGVWQDRTEQHLQFGIVWEKMHPHCRWGGRFSDGNHYSFAPPELVGNRR